MLVEQASIEHGDMAISTTGGMKTQHQKCHQSHLYPILACTEEGLMEIQCHNQQMALTNQLMTVGR